MSKHDPRLTLTQIREAARRAMVHCEGTTLENLRLDWIHLTSFDQQFEIVGEGFKRLPIELRERYPQHDWRSAAGLRDIMAQGYDWIDHEILWDAARDDFPLLFSTVDQLIADLGGELPEENSSPDL